MQLMFPSNTRCRSTCIYCNQIKFSKIAPQSRLSLQCSVRESCFQTMSRYVYCSTLIFSLPLLLSNECKGHGREFFAAILTVDCRSVSDTPRINPSIS